MVYVRHQGPLAGVELTTFGLRDTTATVRPRDEDEVLVINVNYISTIVCGGFSSIINDSLIRQNRVPRSNSDTSFRQQNLTFQRKLTSIIRQHENVAKYFRWFSHDMLSVMVN